MSYQLGIVIGFALFDWVIFSIALIVISDKLGWKKKWPAWIPGLRIYTLGESVGMNKEGMFCGIMDLIHIAVVILRILFHEGQASVLFGLIQLVVFVFLFIVFLVMGLVGYGISVLFAWRLYRNTKKMKK